MHKDAQFIMLDFQKFKLINDVYGHNMGDQYLIVFASIINKVFDDSIVVRLHGDEFAILTKYNPDNIKKRFILCEKMLQLSVLEGKIPTTLKFNAGSVMAEHGIANTKEKADYMMYYAKKNKKQYQEFQEDIWQKKVDENLLLHQFDDYLKHDLFQYTGRQLFRLDGYETDIYQVNVRGVDDSFILNNSSYEILKKNRKIGMLDIYNIQHLLEHIDILDNKAIINVDYQTILSFEQLYEYLRVLLPLKTFNVNNIILSINLKGINYDIYYDLAQKINILKNMGFQIRLDHYSSQIGDEIWENTEIDYIKFANEYWNKAMHSDRVDYSLRKKVDIFMELNKPVIPMFDLIESKEQHQYIESFKYQDILVNGDYYGQEKKLKLRK